MDEIFSRFLNFYTDFRLFFFFVISFSSSFFLSLFSLLLLCFPIYQQFRQTFYDVYHWNGSELLQNRFWRKKVWSEERKSSTPKKKSWLIRKSTNNDVRIKQVRPLFMFPPKYTIGDEKRRKKSISKKEIRVRNKILLSRGRFFSTKVRVLLSYVNFVSGSKIVIQNRHT
jgi:hypothetical protein